MLGQTNQNDTVVKSPISMVADSINSFRQEQKAKAQSEGVNNLTQSSNQNFSNALNANDDNLYKGFNSASQLDGFAAIVKAKGEDRGEDWSMEKNSKDVITRYIKEQHPKEGFVNRLAEYANSDTDPYDFALSEGAALSPEEQRASKYESDLKSIFGENLPSWIVKTYGWTQEVLRDIGLPIDIGYNAVSNALFTQYSDDEQGRLLGAIDNYGWKKFGKHIRELDKYELANAIRELQSEENMAKYEASGTRAVGNAFESAFGTALEIAYPGATELFAAAENTPVLEYGPSLLNAYAQPVGQVINGIVPPLGIFRASLPTEEDKKEWDTFVYSMFAVWNHSRGGNKYDKIVKEDIMEFYNTIKPSALYKAFKEWKNNKINGVKETIKGGISKGVDVAKDALNKGKEYYDESTLKKEVVEPTKEKYLGPDWETKNEVEIATDPEEISKIDYDMKELATKISKGVEDNQRNSVNETLKTLPRDVKAKTNSLQDLSDNVESSIMKRVVQAEDTILKQDRRKFTKDVIEKISSGEVTLEGVKEEPYKSRYGTDPVEDAFKALRNMYEYSEGHAKTPAQAKIEVKWQKYLGEGLTRLEIAELARDLTKAFKLYKPKGMGQYETITAETIEPIRKQLKSIVRDGYEIAGVKDALIELDRIYSDAATTVELISDVIKKARTERGSRDVQTDTQKTASNVIKYTKNMRNAFSDYILNNRKLSPDMVDRYTNYLLKVHDSYFDRLGRSGNNFDKLIEATDKLAKEIDVYETRPEGDVIDGNKIGKGTNKGPKSDGFDDYVEIVEEGPKTKEEAFNNYKSALSDVLKELGVKDVEETVKFITEPLFEVTEGGKRTDFLGRNVSKKPKKSKK